MSLHLLTPALPDLAAHAGAAAAWLAQQAGQLRLDPPPPAEGLPNLDRLYTAIYTWVLRIISGAGGLLLLIDISRHIFSAQRDFRTAGMEAIGLIALIAIASQADKIVPFVLSLLR